MRPFKTLPKYLGIVIVTAVLLISCNNSKGEGQYEEYVVPEEESFEATLQENTASISMSEMEYLESYDQNSGTYVFNKGAKEIDDLEIGEVVLFEGHSLRKITGLSKEGGKLIVNSEFARLTDYFKDAEISYEADINWDNSTAGDVRMEVGQPVAVMINPLASMAVGFEPQDPIGTGGNEGLNVQMEKEINGWKVGFRLTPQSGSKLGINLSAEKEHICTISVEGYISSFTSNMNISIANGEAQRISYNNDGVEGELEVKFAAVGLGSEIAFLEIPAKIERTILVNGFIPVTIRLKANLKIFPEVAVGESSQVSMKFRYNSNTGFSYSEGSLTPRGIISGTNPEQTGDSNTATAGIAGMGVGVEFPRFEIGIIGNTVVPYLLIDTTYSSYLSTGLLGGAPPCHLARLKYKAHAGVSLNFFGIAAINNDYKLFEKEKRWVSDGSQCD